MLVLVTICSSNPISQFIYLFTNSTSPILWSKFRLIKVFIFPAISKYFILLQTRSILQFVLIIEPFDLLHDFTKNENGVSQNARYIRRPNAVNVRYVKENSMFLTSSSPKLLLGEKMKRRGRAS